LRQRNITPPGAIRVDLGMPEWYFLKRGVSLTVYLPSDPEVADILIKWAQSVV